MRRRRPTLLAATLASLLLVPSLASGVAAKEDLIAVLDAPIPMDAPGGTVLHVGLMVWAGPEGQDPVVGSPIYLKLTGRDGSTTREAGAGDKIPGHYTYDIAMPAGGTRSIEVGMHGTSDLPIRLDGQAYAFGGVAPGTAQLSSVPDAAASPVAPAGAPAAGVPGSNAAAGARSNAAAGAPAEGQAPIVEPAVLPGGGLLAGVALLLGAVAVLAVRRRSRAGAPRDAAQPDGARGA